MVPEEKVLEIEIEPGMRDGQEYPFVAEGKKGWHMRWWWNKHYERHIAVPLLAFVLQVNPTLMVNQAIWGSGCDSSSK